MRQQLPTRRRKRCWNLSTTADATIEIGRRLHCQCERLAGRAGSTARGAPRDDTKKDRIIKILPMTVAGIGQNDKYRR